MSRLQNSARPILIPFVQGQFPYLSERARITAAAWATMVVMNCEYWDPETVAISQAQRTAFKAAAAPLPEWFIGIARYAGGHLDGTFYHRALHLNGSDALPGESNCQFTFFALGKVLFHAVSVSAQRGLAAVLGDPLDYGEEMGFRSLWPAERPSLRPSLSVMTDEQVKAILRRVGPEPWLAP